MALAHAHLWRGSETAPRRRTSGGIRESAQPTTHLQKRPGLPFAIALCVGMLAGLQFIVTVYDGWYVSIYFAGEDKDPGRNIPRWLFKSVILVTVIYLAINGAFIRALEFETLRASTLPMAQVIEAVTGRWGTIAVGLNAVLMAQATLDAASVGNPRILYCQDFTADLDPFHVAARSIPERQFSSEPAACLVIEDNGL